MKQSKYLITGDDISEMGLSLLPGKEHLSGKKILTKLEIVSTYYATVSGIDDNNRCVTYERVSPSVYLEINKTALQFLASGGTETITLDTNLSLDQISINKSSSRFSVTKNSNNTITVKANNLGTTVYSQVNDTLTISGGGITRTCSLSQEANEKTSIIYGTPVINFTVSDIPASGGTVKSGNVTYSQSRTQNYTSGAILTLSALTTGGTISYSPTAGITASSLGTTIKSRTSIGTLTATVTMNGKSASSTTTVYQEANTTSYGRVYIDGGTVEDIPASGGTVSEVTGVSATQRIYYTSGSTDLDTIYSNATFIASKSVTASDLGTTETSRKLVGTLSIGILGGGGYYINKEYDVYQEANEKEYGNLSISSFSYSSVNASGGTSTPTIGSIIQYISYTSGSTDEEIITSVSKSFSILSSVSGASINTTSGIVTWTNNTNTSSRTVTVRLTVSANSKTATKDTTCIQNAGVKTYSSVNVDLSYPIIAASGETVYPTISYSQTWGWNGSTTGGGTITSGGDISYSGTSVNTSNGSVSANSKGTVISDITNVTTVTAEVVLNGKNGSDTYTVQQEVNQIEEKFLDLPDFPETVTFEWDTDTVNMKSYLGNVYKKERYTSNESSEGELVGTVATYPVYVKTATIISQDSGLNLNPSAYMLIMNSNDSHIQRTGVIEYEIAEYNEEYNSFIKRVTIIQKEKPVSIGYGSLALTTPAGMFPPYITNYKIDFRSNSTGALIESCIGSPSLLTGQILIIQNVTDSVVHKSFLGGTYLSVSVKLSNADTGEGSLSPVLYSGVLSGSDIQSLKNGTDKVLIVN